MTFRPLKSLFLTLTAVAFGLGTVLRPTATLWRRLLAIALLAFGLHAATPAHAAAGDLDPLNPTLVSPDNVPEGLQKSDWSSIRAAHTAWEHSFMPTEGGHQARNAGQQWTTQFDGRGFLAKPKAAEWQWGLELRSYGFGQQQRAIKGQPAVKAEGQRLSYQWDADMQEWFINDQRGLEHGFTLAQRPQGAAAGAALDVVLGTRGSLKASVAADAQTVHFRDAAGAPVVTYAGLKVWDADGQVLPSRFLTGPEGGLVLRVDESSARYPLTIDPIAQQAYLKSDHNGGATDDNFGQSVAVSGDTVVVGANREDGSATGVNGTVDESASGAGAAYVFVRSGGAWSQQAYLKASQVTADDQFGYSVAVADDTVVVGAYNEDGSATGVNGTVDELATNAGAAYVFVRSVGAWSQQAYLKASQVSGGDQFGLSVAVAGDTVVVGAYQEDGSATGVNGTVNEIATNAGAAYVFVRSGGAWSQQAYLKASQVTGDDNFGRSVAVAGDTVVVGANAEDGSATGVNGTVDESASGSGAAYVFVRSGTTWSQQAYLKASQVTANDFFGLSVAVAGDTVVVGAYLEDGSATGVDGTVDESASDAGAAYVFVRSGTTWSQQAYLKASQVTASDQFGLSVAVAGDTVVVGANRDDGSATGVNGTVDELAINAGAAYVFVRSGTTWSQQAYLKASQVTASDNFGGSVAVAGDTVVVGALNEDGSATGVNGTVDESASGAGAAYVFVRSGTTWSQQAYAKASNTPQGTGVNDNFGISVAVAGDTVVVGAYLEDGSATGVNGTVDESATNAGAAYVFVRSGTTWSQQAYLKASQVSTSDFFGISVAVAGDTVVVGASSEDGSATGVNGTVDESASSAGAAYVFVRSGGAWSQQAYLKASQISASDNFGISVAVAGDTVVVGVNFEDGSATGVNGTVNESASNAGAAYVFVRSGGAWSQQAYLKASQVSGNDQFGFSVAVAGDTVVVGAFTEDGSATGVNGTVDELANGAGAAYVFVRSGTTWSQQAYLKASQVSGGDQFGYSVAVAGDTVVVGALLEDGSATGVNGTVDELAFGAGAAYVFVRSGTTWSQQAYLKASQVTASDNFGISVAVAGDTVVVGANLEDGSATGVNGTVDELASLAGAAYVFVRSGTAWSQQAYLKASQVTADDRFGWSVAVAGDTVVVGAYLEDGSATGVNGTVDETASASGAAYIFTGFGPVATAPVVTNVTSSTADGAYGTAQSISIQVTFDASVTVTGTPTLALNSGGTASYTSGSPGTTLTFNYTVGASQTAADLDYSATNSLSLAGGEINATTGGTAATLTLPTPGAAGSLGANKALVIDTTAPSIGIGSPSASSINAGAGSVTYTVTYADTNFSASTLANGNITLNTTGTANGTVNVSGSGLTRTVTISSITGSGTVGISIASGTASDTAGNLAAAAGPSTTFTVVGVPGAPTIGTATAGNTTASVAFTAPASDGGSAITGYTVTASPGGATGTGTVSPITVNGLTNGTAYTFTVTATNIVGTGSASAASNSVTPMAAGADYTVTTAAGVMTITDSSGNADTLAISEPSAGNILFTATGRTFSLNGAASTTNNSGNISLTSVTSIIVNTAAGVDIINVGAFSGTSFPSLTLNGGTGNDTVNLNGDITFAANANLDLDLQNDNATPGVDIVNVATTANLITSGTGTITVKVSQNVAMAAGSSFETVNGDLTVEANQQATPTAANFSGITVNGGTIETKGTGALALRGKSGQNATSFVLGVSIVNNGRIQSTSSAPGAGTIDITGQCADGSTNGAYGASISGTGSTVSSAAGNIHVTGNGGNTTGPSSAVTSVGLRMGTAGTITATGTAAITIDATSGTAAAGSSFGIDLRDASTAITAVNGNILITATGGNASVSSRGLSMSLSALIATTGSGSITVDATAGTAGATGASYAIDLRDASTAITAVNGNILITATGGNAPAAPSGSIGTVGLYVVSGALISTTGSGSITATGSAGSTSSLAAAQGLRVDAPSQITSTTGDITLTGNGGTSPGIGNHGASIRGNITATSTGNITLNGTAGTPNAVAASGSHGVQVRGGAIVSSAGGNVALNGTSANTTGNEGITIAIAGTGTVSIADPAHSITVVSDSIFIDATNGSLNAGTGTVTLRQKTNAQLIAIGAADSATTLGLTDAELDRITAGTLNIGNTNSGAITISAVISPASYRTLSLIGNTTFSATGGFTSDVTSASVFEKITVNGTVDITAGAALTMASAGGYVWNGTDTFTLLANDAADTITGTFTGPTLTSFLGSALTAQQSYTGGTGNDLVLGSLNQPPAFSGYSFTTPKNTMALIGTAKLLARASDPDGGTPVISSVTATSTQGGSVSLSGGNVLYTPADDYTGPDTFTFTISDGQGGSFLATVNVTVTPGTGVTQNRASLTILPGGNVSLVFAGIPGQNYLVQRSVDLVTWTTLTNATAAADGLIPWTDTSPPPGAAFYRTAVPVPG